MYRYIDKNNITDMWYNPIEIKGSQMTTIKFFTCPYHEIIRVEAVGLPFTNFTCKFMIFVSMWNSGQFHEKSIFCSNHFIKLQI